MCETMHIAVNSVINWFFCMNFIIRLLTMMIYHRVLL